MRYVDEFRNQKLIKKFSDGINAIAPQRKINIMEVCGTHTHNFYRFGLDKLLPKDLRLISGPGCPVCVSPQEYIDTALKLARQKGVILLTFGDMLCIPGRDSTLEKERARLGNVQVVYSAWDALKIAKLNPDKRIVFLAVGFETTAPTIALSIMRAKKENLKNLSFLTSLKLIPPAMEYLLQDARLNLDGFLCPGHVSAIIGTKVYGFIPKKYGIACCVAGFEPLDILEGIYFLVRQIVKNKPAVENQYARVVNKAGNRRGLSAMKQAFKTLDASWRGLGKIPKSGLKIKPEYSQFDAAKEFSITYGIRNTEYGQRKCKCGDVLKGLIAPVDCKLFAKTCTPDNPIGPCMVSSEGACNAYFKFKK